MQFQSLTPNLMVEDMTASLHFYRELLGFQMLMSVPENPPFQWVMLQKEQAALMLQSRESISEELPQFRKLPCGASLTLFIKMDDVGDLYQSLKEQIALIRDLQETFYGMCEFTVEDPNGYILTFASEIK